MLNETSVWIASSIAKENGITVNDLGNIFSQLSTYDNDFNGNNGEDYLWEEAEEKGFETNADYLINEVLKNYDYNTIIGKGQISKLISMFLNRWLGSDCYYDGYDYEFDIVNNVLFVAVAISIDN